MKEYSVKERIEYYKNQQQVLKEAQDWLDTELGISIEMDRTIRAALKARYEYNKKRLEALEKAPQ